MTSAASIVAATLAYNAEYPEAEAEILAGTPELVVTTHCEGAYGRRRRFVINFGVRLPDGGFAAAGTPDFVTLDAPRNVSRSDQATRRYTRLARTAGVALKVVDR